MSSRQQLQELQRGWRPPDGLDRSRPRDVRLTAGGGALAALSAALFAAALVVGVGLEVVAEREHESRRLLRDEGADARGEVVRLWRARGEKRQPWVAYRFTVDERAHEAAVRAPLGLWRRLAVGSPLEVRYLPSDPHLNHPRGLEPQPMPPVVPYLAAAALAALGALPLVAIRGQRRLLTEGRAARAVVTRHSKDQHGTVAHYEFATLGGTTAAGKLGPTRKPVAVGSTLCVIYDPESPKNNAAYPLSIVRHAHGPLTPPGPARRRPATEERAAISPSGGTP